MEVAYRMGVLCASQHHSEKSVQVPGPLLFYLFSRSTNILKGTVFQTTSLNPLVVHEINLTVQALNISKVEKKRAVYRARSNIVSKILFWLNTLYTVYSRSQYKMLFPIVTCS